jgi:uncharacterized membrane protein
MRDDLQTQLDELARRVSALELERRPPTAAQTREPGVRARPTPWPARATQPPVQPPPPQPPDRDPVDLSGLLGAKTLAIAGGVVTLLGVVFFFVLATNRGWIGPGDRIALGAAASLIVFWVGLELRRRFGATHAALTAVGTGIAGAYVTLVAATELYHLLTPGGALIAAAAIAGIGVATALAWRSELVAAFGLIGAIVAPVALAVQGGFTNIGATFAALMFAATAFVALRCRWQGLLIASIAVSAPQIAVHVLIPRDEWGARPDVIPVAALFAGVYLATGIAYHLLDGRGRLGGITTTLILGAGVLAVGSSWLLLETPLEQGAAMLVVASVYGVLAGVFHVRRDRDLSALLAAAAFIAGALALASLLTGEPLTYAWAAESAAIAWLARRTKEIRFRFWSTVYAGLAVGHLLTVDAPARELITPDFASADGALPALAVAAALAAYAALGTRWPELDQPDAEFAAFEPVLTGTARWGAGILATYSASLAIVGLSPSFGWAHVGVAALWFLAGLGIVLVAGRRRNGGALLGGELWLTASAFFVFAHASLLDQTPRGWSFVVLGASLLAAAHTIELRRGREGSIDPVAALAVLVGQAGFLAAAGTLLHTKHGFGLAVLALGALDAILAATLFSRRAERDFVAVLWGTGAVLVAAAVPLLLDGVEVTIAWAFAAAALAGLARLTREERFLAGSAGFAGLALLHALALDAPLEHLFGTGAPRGGTLGLFAVTCAIAAIAAATRRHRGRVVGLAGVVAVYGLSIAILRVTDAVYPGGPPDSAFHTGHTLVSSFWGLIALGLLYAGLKHYPALRLAGFAVFAIALGKLFLFDLSFLDSVTRALSFLAVGAVLLAGGFFYQRLTVTLRAGGD